MTDKERQTLCNILRTMEPWPCKEAANEIERLAKRVEELERECGRFENELFEAHSTLSQSDAKAGPGDIEDYARTLEKENTELLTALAQPDTKPCKICGGSGQIRYLGRDNSEEVEDCSCRLAQSAADPKQDIRKALEGMLDGAYCETTGVEDLEAGCCRVCRARAALARPDEQIDLREAIQAALHCIPPGDGYTILARAIRSGK